MKSVREILIAHAIHFNGDWDKLFDSISDREYLSSEEITAANMNLKCKALTIADPEYPEYLRHAFKPPIVLFYEGDISLIQDPSKCLAVVGTRKPTEKGKAITREIVHKTCKEYITVSGLASGIDRIAHVTAIRGGGKTIAVLGSGIDYCYPTENNDIFKKIKENHLLISEYPPGSPPNQGNFPQRNRLIAIFSKGVLITESSIRSGTSITANFGLSFGREVMCVPSDDFNNSGCNLFIKEGAALVENAEDVFLNMRSGKYYYR